jgi:hypothetical protein
MAAGLVLAGLSSATSCVSGAPAWRSLQSVPATLLQGERGSLQGAPPCLATLQKVGKGHDAAWLLGTYHDEELDMQVKLALDRNPHEPCCKLQFACAERGKLGHMLLACGENHSALRGMRIREDLRGRGYSKVLLAIWITMCLEASLTPCTRTINKPLLSLSLASFGFTPTNQRGRIVSVSSATRLRDCEQTHTFVPGRTTYVRTEFEPPADAQQLRAAAE